MTYKKKNEGNLSQKSLRFSYQIFVDVGSTERNMTENEREK